jgi:DNA-directed RNA polymerase beta' subunit
MGIPGGLADSGLFGDLRVAGHESSPPTWGFIRLPVDVEFPVDVFLGKNWENILASYGRSKADLPSIRILPVLPLRYRIPLMEASAARENEIVREGYTQILRDAARYNDARSEDDRQSATEGLNAHVRHLFEFLVEALCGKQGLIRHYGLGRRVDRSARLVITPNPALEWDQVGVPTAVLLELWGDEIDCWIEKKQGSPDLFDRIVASGFKGSSSRTLTDWRWMKSGRDEFVLEGAHAMVVEFFKEYPDKVVLLNRQPSLHRDSFQAFHPVPLSPLIGDVIQLCPLACKGFGADFDGDEMVVHIPLSPSAQDEATRLLPSRNMLSLATGGVTANFDQDMVLGTYWLTRDQGELREAFKELFQEQCCQGLVSSEPMMKAQSTRLLAHLAQSHPEKAPKIVCDWMRLAFDCCTQMGVSFGFYDLLDLTVRVGDLTNDIKQASSQANPSAVNKAVQARIERVLGERLVENDPSAPGLQFAAMALSGARGRDQARQLIGSRAFLSPGAIVFDAPVSRFVFEESLAGGMSPEAAFFSAMNSRSSMCDKKLGTRQAGYLTRRLVTALWHYRISASDCGSEDAGRSILTCTGQDGCCAACYGRLPNGTFAPFAFPVGLIAAQSIGERGTQLSMQSFHTGQKAFSILDVLDILDSRKEANVFDRPQDAPLFITLMQQSSAYRGLRDCHFQILWRVIHRSPERSLKSAIESLGLFTRISFEKQARHLFLGALMQEQGLIDEPPANVLFNRLVADQQPGVQA